MKHLPRLFLGFSRLLVSSWQHEAVVLATCNFLAINATLKYSPVMIQAYGVRDAATTMLVPFPYTPDDKGNSFNYVYLFTLYIFQDKDFPGDSQPPIGVINRRRFIFQYICVHLCGSEVNYHMSTL